MNEFPPRMIVCIGSVVLQENQVLLVRQTYGDTAKGKWSIPWGFVQGDTPDTYNDPSHKAAIRETFEEAGITAEIEGLLGIQHADLSKEGFPRVYLLYLCRHLSGEPQPDNVETDQAAYFSLQELKNRRAEVLPFCYWLAARVLEGNYTLIPPSADNPYSPNVAFL
jgi:ADP-ribose pyrophosphatase YjhB (NUDIX family)